MDRYDQIRIKLTKKNKTFHPPAPLSEIENFEQKYSISLPDSYRTFLLRVADGGIMLDGFPLLSLSKLQISQEIVQKEFPLWDYWIWEDDKNVCKTRLKEIEYGNIELINIGCAQTWNLILSGKCAGEMWSFSEVGVQPACPRRDFVSWFEYWLDGEDDYFTDFPVTIKN